MSIPPDTHYIPAYSIEDILLDKDTGQPLSGGLVYFFRDSQRGDLKPVYQITGTSPDYSFIALPNPVVLSSIGTFEDSLDNPVIPYFYPYDAAGNVDLYYIVVTSSTGVNQFDREAQPFIPPSGSVTISNAFSNEISNPQFINVLFDTQSAATYTYSFSGVTNMMIPIAPDWNLVVTSPGVGSVVVAQNNPEGIPTGALNLVTNPGTYLNINSTGLTDLRLRQRIFGSPNLWGSGYLAGSFVAKNETGTAAVINMLYSQSNGAITNQVIVSATVPGNGTFAAYPGSFLIPASNSTDFYPGAYVDIDIQLPPSVEMDVTSIMVAPTGAANINGIVYEQTTNARQVDQLFHYYQPQLNFKPIPSLLTGWDFPLNPAQFLTSSVTMTTTAAYIWDQTICQSVVGNIAVVRNAVSSGFQATTANTNEAFYMLQYLEKAQAQEILGNMLAVNVNAYISQAGGPTTCQVFLYRGSSAAVFPVIGAAGSIGGATPLAANGVFTKNNVAAQGLNWTLIARANLGAAKGLLPVVTTADYSTINSATDLNFNGWQVTDSTEISDTNKFAIVVTFSCPTSGTVVTVNSIGLMKGNIATRPAPQTIGETLRTCQYYYQKSFLIGTLPADNLGIITGPTTGVQTVASGTVGTAIGPIVRFATPMRAAPQVALYNPAAIGTAGQINDITHGVDWSSSTSVSAAALTANGFTTQGTTPGGSAIGDLLAVHWTADSRLAVVV